MKIKTTHNIIIILSILLFSAFVYGQERNLANEQKQSEFEELQKKIMQAASVSDAT